MNIRLKICLSLLTVVILSQAAGAQEQSDSKDTESKTSSANDDFESIFDGESLDGWSGDEKFWSVENGYITGRTTKETPTEKNTFLIWKNGELTDFELRLKFKIVDGNSGIQFRSTDLGDFHVGGYQADIDATNSYTGILFEEKGRGILCRRTKKITIEEDGKKSGSDETTCDDEEFLASLDAGGWNEFVISAKGNHIIQTINGFVTAEVVDKQKDKSKSSGILALQLHAGPPMTVHFKEIELKKLKKD